VYLYLYIGVCIADVTELIQKTTTTPGNSDSDSDPLFPVEAEQHTQWYDTMRFLNGMAEGPELYNRIPLECNLDELQCVDFNKGCYMGQELTARTKYQVCIYVYCVLWCYSLAYYAYMSLSVCLCIYIYRVW